MDNNQLPNALFDTICSQTQHCIDKLNLLPTKHVVVGLSGGKDSSLLTLVLHELGYHVYPVIIQLGCNIEELETIKTNFAVNGISVEIVDAVNYCNTLPCKQRSHMSYLIQSVLNKDLSSPCTYCSQIRRAILLNYSLRMNVNNVAYGYHKEDLVTTMLKDYYVYNYYKQFKKYDKTKFQSFVKGNKPILSLIEALINEKQVGTMSILQKHDTGIRLVRPFALVSEYSIAQCCHLLKMKVISNSCSLDNISKREPTKREIVHEKTLSLCTDECFNYLTQLTLKCLDGSGVSRYNPRANREKRFPGFED